MRRAEYFWNVETIETKNWGELHYPFDIPTKQEYPSKGWSRSSSYGFLSEKIPLSFFDVSLLYNIGGHSELYGTFTSYILGGGFGLGYKYYTMHKSKNLMYISAGMARYFFGEFSPDISGFSIATGVSKYKSEKTSLNIGIFLYNVHYTPSFSGLGNEVAIGPFINLERRF